MNAFIDELVRLLVLLVEAAEDEEHMIADVFLNDQSEDDDVFQCLSSSTQDIILSIQDTFTELFMADNSYTSDDVARELADRGYAVRKYEDEEETVWDHCIQLTCGKLRF